MEFTLFPTEGRLSFLPMGAFPTLIPLSIPAGRPIPTLAGLAGAEAGFAATESHFVATGRLAIGFSALMIPTIGLSFAGFQTVITTEALAALLLTLLVAHACSSFNTVPTAMGWPRR